MAPPISPPINAIMAPPKLNTIAINPAKMPSKAPMGPRNATPKNVTTIPMIVPPNVPDRKPAAAPRPAPPPATSPAANPAIRGAKDRYPAKDEHHYKANECPCPETHIHPLISLSDKIQIKNFSNNQIRKLCSTLAHPNKASLIQIQLTNMYCKEPSDTVNLKDTPFARVCIQSLNNFKKAFCNILCKGEVAIE